MSAKTEAKLTSTTIPKEWPGAFQLYKFSKETMLVNWRTYLGVLLVAVFFSMVVSAVFGSDPESGRYSLGNLVNMLLSIYITAASTVVLFKSLKREKIGFNEAMSDALQYYLPFIAMSVLMYAVLGVSLLLFIIPFFFVLPRVALSPYFLIGKNIGPVEAVKASWDETKGHSGKVWGIIGVNILFALLMITIIGIPFAIYFLFLYSAASILLYSWIQTHGNEAIAAPSTEK